MNIFNILKLANSFDKLMDLPWQEVFGRRLNILLKEFNDKNLTIDAIIKISSKIEYALSSALEEAKSFNSHPSEAKNAIRLIKSCLSMFHWARNARLNKNRSEELAAIEAATSVLKELAEAFRR